MTKAEVTWDTSLGLAERRWSDRLQAAADTAKAELDTAAADLRSQLDIHAEVCAVIRAIWLKRMLRILSCSGDAGYKSRVDRKNRATLHGI
eukprot:SAG31_NODE_2086_length_6484_cov_23.518716_5_plen_91_part_00